MKESIAPLPHKNMEEDKKILNVYLADLANDLFEIDNKSIPIGIGYVGAYCKSVFGSGVNLKLFRTATPLLEEINKNPPDIVGLGSYDWNYNLTLKIAQKIKKMYPEIIIVVGGANVDISPSENKLFLEHNAFVDCLVFGDGERPFSKIVQLGLDLDKTEDIGELIRATPIDGVRSLCKGELVMGEKLDNVKELDEIPSPYLTGLFDEFLEDGQLMPIIQKVRGCPNHCTFCVSGSHSTKLRSFSVERVKAEIDYLRKNAKNRILRMSDDNFGIFKGDLQIAEYLNETNKKHHYPVGLKVYTSKYFNKDSQEMALLLRSLSLLNISLQTADATILKTIKRSQSSLDEILKNLDFARKNSLPTGSEVILGLPGETLTTAKATIDTAVGLKFDSITVLVLWLLRGSSMASRASREKYQFKSKYMLAENAISMVDGEISFEADELAVASSTYSYEDYKTFLRYSFICDFAIGSGYAKELLYHGLSFGVNPSRVFDELLSHPNLYPTVNKTTDAFLENYLGHMFDTRDELGDFIRKNVDNWIAHKKGLTVICKSRMIPEFVIGMLFKDPEQKVFCEFEKAINALYDGPDHASFSEITKNVRDFTKLLIVNPEKEVKKDVTFSSYYRYHDWVTDGYVRSLTEYKTMAKRDYTLSVRNYEFIKHLAEKDKSERKNCFNFYRYANSTDRKRFININN